MRQEQLKRVFFDWGEALMPQVAPRLLRVLEEKNCLILVPTSSSGEVLKQALVEYSPQQALLLPPIMTTASFKRSCLSEQVKAASPCESLMAWVEVLRNCSEGELKQLINLPKGQDRSFSALFGLAESILRLETTLSNELLSFEDVLPLVENDLLRWDILARFSAKVNALLAQGGSLSLLESDRECVAHPSFPAGVECIILLAQPDPTPVSLRLLEQWMQFGKSLEIWTYAPEAHAETFDAWGRPLADLWNHKLIDIPHGNDAITLSANPSDTASQVISFFSQANIHASDAAVGIADPSMESEIEEALSSSAWKPYRAEGSSLQQSALHHLILQLIAYLKDPQEFTPIDKALRNPLLLSALHQKNAYPFIQELDRIKAKHHPEGYSLVLKILSPQSPTRKLLCDAQAWMSSWTSKNIGKRAHVLADELERQHMYHGCEALRQCAQEITSLEEKGMLNNASDALYLLDQLFTKQIVYADPTGTHIKLQGWLELLYQDAPYLALVGMHEGCVPDAQIADSYLPESFKARLGIRGRAHRAARDAYLFTTLLERRRKQGQLQVFISKTNSQQDPLFPSSLLMRCTKDELPARIGALLQDNIQPLTCTPIRNHQDFNLGTPQERNPWKENPEKHFSPSVLKDFLQCPKRFWLEHICKMKPVQISSSLNPLDYGSLIHSSLEILNSPELKDSIDADKIHAALYDAYKQNLAKLLYTQNQPTSPIDIQTRFTNLRLLYAAEAHAEAIQEGWILEETERDIDRWEIAPGYFLSMKIDAIYRHSTTGDIRIIDYKTNKKGKRPQEAHLNSITEDKQNLMALLLPLIPCYEEEPDGPKKKAKIYRWVNLQLPLYALWAKSHYGTASNIETAYINLPLSKENSGFQGWENLDYEKLAHAQACTIALIDSIRQAEFTSLPSAEELKWKVYPNNAFTALLSLDPSSDSDD